MKGFFDRINTWLSRSMAGRYGTDDLSKCLLTVSLISLVLFLFFRGPFFVIAVALLIWSYYRMLSKDFGRRREENARYLELSSGIRKKLRVQKKRFDGRKDFRFFKCPGCGQEVRVPKGKGHIRITCPKCGIQFDRTV